MNLRSLAVSGILATGLIACSDLPRDPEQTLRRVEGHRLRVGLVEQPPWVIRGKEEPAGVEADLVRRFAHELSASPEWHWAGEQQHMEALEHFDLDLVVGGITDDTAWRRHVGLTSPYFDERPREGKRSARRHVMVAPPGENGFIKRLDEFLARQHADVPGMLPQEASQP
jgi:polar amino acid transport system substrate-binding protein